MKRKLPEKFFEQNQRAKTRKWKFFNLNQTLWGAGNREFRFRESPGLFADFNKRLGASNSFGVHVLSHRCAPCERNGKDSARCPTQFLAAIGLIK